MDVILTWLAHAGIVLAWLFMVLCCLGGVVMSCISLSGTWLILLAAIISHLLRPDLGPGWGTVIAFGVVCIVVELVEWLASSWGVTKRGGSGWAGAAALVGGMAGMILGTFIPVPVAGSLFGMMVGSFAAAFAVERHRLKNNSRAANIAWGAVLARIGVILVKVVTTLAMIVVLVIALL